MLIARWAARELRSACSSRPLALAPPASSPPQLRRGHGVAPSVGKHFSRACQKHGVGCERLSSAAGYLPACGEWGGPVLLPPAQGELPSGRAEHSLCSVQPAGQHRLLQSILPISHLGIVCLLFLILLAGS